MDKIFIYILLLINDNIVGIWWCIVLIVFLYRDD